MPQISPHALSRLHRASVYELARVLYRAHTHNWQTTPAPRESYARPSESPRTNVQSAAARFIRYDATLVRHGIAMQVRAAISERDYRHALTRLNEAQQAEITAYYRRAPYVSREGRESAPALEVDPTTAYPDLARARHAQTFAAFEALLAQLL